MTDHTAQLFQDLQDQHFAGTIEFKYNIKLSNYTCNDHTLYKKYVS